MTALAAGVVLAIDLGTGGPKVALVDAEGRVLAWRSRPLATVFLPDGGAEQDTRAMWDAIVTAARELLASGVWPPVVAVAVTSQYMSAVPVGADGHPTGPCVMWMDTRGAEHNQAVLQRDVFELFATRHGLIPLPTGTDNVAHAEVMRRYHPGAYASAVALLEPLDAVTARLTGRVVATQSSVFGSLACDNRTWGSGYDDELVEAARLDRSKLAPLVPMDRPVGVTLAAVAAELGIPEGIPVLPGTIDSITGAIGCGALDADQAGVVIGTTSVLVTHVDSPRNDLFTGVLSVPSPLPQRWFVMAENGLGGRALDWVLATFAAGDPVTAIAAASEVPPGAEGVAFMPWLLGSLAPAPDDDQRGGFTGLSVRHDRRHMVRAALEGIALNLAWLRPAVEEMVGQRYRRFRFAGGGAQSTVWAQILADALDAEVERLDDPRATNARGAALLAWYQLGVLTLDQVRANVPVASVHAPDPAARPVMAAALERLIATHAALASIRASGT